jgi:CheY-like chemotaxis protein
MVVDDSVDLADVLAMALRQEGVHVEIVTRRFEMLRDETRWASIDAAVIDLNLPGDMDGIALLHWLARNAPHVRRVAFTGIPRHMIRRDVDCDAYIEKPSSPREILAAVGYFPLAPVPRRRLSLRDPASAGLVWLAACYAIAVAVMVSMSSSHTQHFAEVSHLSSFAGYLFIAVFFAPHIRTSLIATKASAIVFFGSGAILHLLHFLRSLNDNALDYTSHAHALLAGSGSSSCTAKAPGRRT